MYKLGALDAGFLYSESDRSPQHVASVQIMKLPEQTSPAEFVEQLKQFLLKRIHLVPYLTNKLQEVPFAMDHPEWVRDGDFSIENHVHTAIVGAPGGKRQLEQMVAELHGRVMDRTRPLWDLWVLTGLEDGNVAYYNRVHHACIDGMAGQAATQILMDTSTQPADVPAVPEDFFTTNTRRTAGAMMLGAWQNLASFQGRQFAAWMSNLETAAKLVQRIRDPRKGLGAAAEPAPRTRFNHTVEAERSYATGEIRIDEMKAMGKVGDATINDLFVAICGGGLRRYLARSGELEDKSLIAGCPVSLRKPGDTGMDNKVTMMQVSMATDVEDPVERLERVVMSANVAKGFVADLADSYDPNVALPGMPGLLTSGLKMLEQSRLLDLAAPDVPFNVVVSNVPGPRETLYSAGARMLTHYPVSIPAHMQGVNITVQSYAGVMYFAITACAKALPNADRLVADMLSAYEELHGRLLPAAPRDIRESRPKKRVKTADPRPGVGKAA